MRPEKDVDARTLEFESLTLREAAAIISGEDAPRVTSPEDAPTQRMSGYNFVWRNAWLQPACTDSCAVA